MWVNRQLFEMIVVDNKALSERCTQVSDNLSQALAHAAAVEVQKAKDDTQIDWLRSRVNALERERSVLLAKTTGVHLAVPEIVRQMPEMPMQAHDFNQNDIFNELPEELATKMGIVNRDDGTLEFTK